MTTLLVTALFHLGTAAPPAPVVPQLRGPAPAFVLRAPRVAAGVLMPIPLATPESGRVLTREEMLHTRGTTVLARSRLRGR
jgi:hypothetical protein